MPDQPNVLIFCVDEMRADYMACAGNQLVRTPNLDRIAAWGTVFSRSYCNNPICMPARATMFTGMLPRDHGLRVNGQSLRKDIPTLAGTLAQAGYRTHAAGKLHLTPWRSMVQPPDPRAFPEDLDYWGSGAIDKFPCPYYGFQSVDMVGGHTAYAYGTYLAWLRRQGGDPELLLEKNALEELTGAPTCYKMALPEELHYNRYIADSTIKLIRESGGNDCKPFFAWCSFPDPHMPIAPPRPYCEMYVPASMPLPARHEGELEDLPPVYRRIMNGEFKPNGTLNTGVTDNHWREMIAGTYGMVTHLDAEIGRVLDALEETAAIGNTVIVFISDHGDMMGDHGLLWKAFYSFQGCIRIPTITAAPGMPGGQVCETLVSQIDLMPSVLDLCGVPLPGSDWIKRETPFERGAVMPLQLYPGRSWAPLLKSPQGLLHKDVVIENDDPTTGYRVRTMVTQRHRLSIYPGADDGELFDLENDPDELFNLWYLPEHETFRQELRARLLDAYSADTPLYPIAPWNA